MIIPSLESSQEDSFEESTGVSRESMAALDNKSTLSVQYQYSYLAVKILKIIREGATRTRKL